MSWKAVFENPRSRRYVVELAEGNRIKKMGSVLLREGASPPDVEAALVPLGIYMPRGADRLEWVDPRGDGHKVALIFEYGEGDPAVILYRWTDRKTYAHRGRG